MSSKKEEILNVLSENYLRLSKWEIRSRIGDNPIAAVAFFMGLKYISDNKQLLGLDYPEKYDMDYLALLYGEKVTKEEFVMHIEQIELQLGYSKGILKSFVSNLELLDSIEATQEILKSMNVLDFQVSTSGEHTAYEALVTYISIQSRNDLRFAKEYITDDSLTKLIAQITNVQDHMSVYDFCAGYNLLLSEVSKGKEVKLYAQELDQVAAAVGMMVLIMSGQSKAVVSCNDTITYPLTIDLEDKKFDRVVSTPPYGLRIADKMATFKSGDQANAFEYGLAYKLSGDLVFARHLLASLKPDGMGVIILPMATLFKSGMDGRIRGEMIRDNVISTIIELPIGIIPGVNVKSALVIFEKNKADDTIYLVDMSKDETKEYVEKVGRKGVKLTEQGIAQIIKMMDEKQIISGIATVVNHRQIVAHRGNLCPGAYLQEDRESEIAIEDIEVLVEKDKQLMQRLYTINNQLESKLNQ